MGSIASASSSVAAAAAQILVKGFGESVAFVSLAGGTAK
jgi:hypothetical protein